jgi:hypothetical protein
LKHYPSHMLMLNYDKRYLQVFVFVILLQYLVMLNKYKEKLECNQKSYDEEGQTIQWQKKWQKDKQRSTKHYAENKRLSNITTTKNQGWTHVFMRGKQFLLHMWHPSCYSFHKFGDKSWMRNGQDYDSDKQEHIHGHVWHRYSEMADRTNNNPQHTTLKAKDWATMTPQKTGGKLMLSGRVSSSCSNIANQRFTRKEESGRRKVLWLWQTENIRDHLDLWRVSTKSWRKTFELMT